MTAQLSDIQPATTTTGQVRSAIAFRKAADARLANYLDAIRSSRPKTAMARRTEALRER